MANARSGWYPDPEDSSRERWWDGGAGRWLEHTRNVGGPGAAGPPPPPVKKSFRLPLIVGGIIVVLLAVSGIVNAARDDEDQRATTAATSSSTNATPAAVETAPTTTTAINTSPAAAPPDPSASRAPRCDRAPSRIVDIINASFNDADYALSAPAFSVSAPRDLIYVSADILRGRERAMSEAVWIADGPAVYALSGSARRSSLLPDGRDALDVSAGDDYGLRAQGCVGAAR